MDARKWLAHSRALAGTGPGRPPVVDLRRGVSASYYALYHELTRHAAETACDLLEVARGTGSYQALMALLALATRELR